MVTVTNRFLLGCSLIALLFSTASSVFENLISEDDPCHEVCQKTYSFHSSKRVHRECCERGCRLYSIIELVVDEDGVNGTMKSCYEDCKNAYPGETEHTSACILGCRSQRPFAHGKGQQQVTDLDLSAPEMDMPNMLYPLLYIHNMYSHMVDRATSQMCVSWSVLVQDGAGKLVVFRSQLPSSDVDVQDFDDYTPYRGTSSVFETNIEPAGNTATEVLRHSQLKSARSFGDGINAAEADLWRNGSDESSSTDWLTCIARKTGLPRLLLCVIILLSAIAMVWLCLSAAVTAPDHKISQKLSIPGDLEYLRYLPEKKGIQGVHPQDFVQARPLPVKIRVEKI